MPHSMTGIILKLLPSICLGSNREVIYKIPSTYLLSAIYPIGNRFVCLLNPLSIHYIQPLPSTAMRLNWDSLGITWKKLETLNLDQEHWEGDVL